jgi:hypothetical protein
LYGVIAQPSITSTSFNSYSDVGTMYSASFYNRCWFLEPIRHGIFQGFGLTNDGNYSAAAVATAPSNGYANFFVKNTETGDLMI